MARGYMGKMLRVDLTQGTLEDEELDEQTARDFLGGYGLGAKLLFERQPAGADPLGPDAILGFTTGMITGTDHLGGSRYTVVGKSPLTGGWGDANSGGYFGPYLKFAGYDDVWFTGISDEPVYLYIENGKAELRDAADLWGKDSFETEDILRARHGRGTEIACIGPSGEKVCRIAAVMNNKGRAAGRSGLGAVMGAKKLKAVAVKGDLKIPTFADEAAMKQLRKDQTAKLGGHIVGLRDFGTPGIFTMCCKADDAPTKNWAGVAEVDLPSYEKLGADPVVALQERRYACWKCPVGCGGHMKASTDNSEYQWEGTAHKPEYETLAMFGPNLLNDNLDSVIKVNDICNREGVDTISAGACIAFTLECYQNGLITKEDTGGLEMSWGNHQAIVAMTEKMCRREGFGDIIADGVKLAAGRIGKGAEQYAMHVGGQEFAAHDSRGGMAFSISYGADPTPGRHTQGGEGHPKGVMPEYDRQSYQGRGKPHAIGNNFNHVINSIGSCAFIVGGFPEIQSWIDGLRTLSGWDITIEELITTGERINQMREAFNVREGVTLPFKYPDRMMGKPPKEVGPRAGITLNEHELFDDYFKAMSWDGNGRPSKERLLELGLGFAAKELYK
jgi:aldehyde:ferredoxin oxidoreductase